MSATPSAQPRDRFGGLTAEQVARLDAAAIAGGVSTLQLMEIAGWQVARCAWRMLGFAPASVAVVAGHGNNGGDGRVAARHLDTWGCSVTVIEAAMAPSQADLAGAALVIDALLGTGLRSAPREPQAAAIRSINAARAPVLSIDVPSGLDATTGEAFDPCVRATLTCTLGAMKAGLWTGDAAACAGAIWVADIGMPAAAYQRCGLRQPPEPRGGELVPVTSATEA